MKKIIAIIRNECVAPARAALGTIGIRGVTLLRVLWQRQEGRGKDMPASCDPWHIAIRDRSRQRHTTLSGTATTGSPGVSETGCLPDFFPGTMLILAVPDEDVLPVVRALARVHQGRYRYDGRIFVCPLVTAAGIGAVPSGDPVIL